MQEGYPPLSISEYRRATVSHIHNIRQPTEYCKGITEGHVHIITNDIQPITNGRIAKKVRAIRGEANDQITFVTEVFLAGLTAYEELLAKYGGQFSVRDFVSMADVCFASAVEMALVYRTNLDGLPRVMGIFKTLGELPAFQKGNGKVQGDTPEAMRSP